ncbi:hypothetical protein KKH27_06740 [bacterium]|nr:hypothetical protein [bacterium]MBU1983306.1 hypothetical protein [bacterium]
MTRFLWRIGLLVSAALWLAAGCRESAVSPFDSSPAEGTRLYFADCEPFPWQGRYSENVTLVPDPQDACNSNIPFFYGYSAVWRSNSFRVAPGTISEGVHLVFHRNTEQAAVATSIDVAYGGIAVNIQRQLDLPIGEAVSVMDLLESGEISGSGDTAAVTLTMTLVSGAATLNVNIGSGSYVQVGVERTGLCEFVIDLGLAGGVGQPGSGVTFTYAHAAGNVQAALFEDFTRGAHVDGSTFFFGPKYGIAYLTAESDLCRDTAAFVAMAPAQGFRMDTLATVLRGNLLSDGDHVWFWEDQYLPDDSLARRNIRILHETELPLLSHPIYTRVDPVIVYYDGLSSRFWIIQRSGSAPDTAWGYTISGSLDTLVVAASIPTGFLFRQMWLNVTAQDRYTRTVMAIPFAGGASSLFGIYPTELSEGFGGAAGLGYPLALGQNEWSVNVFDDEGDWIARYPVRVSQNEDIYNVILLSTVGATVFVVDAGCCYYVRALKSQ